MAVVLSLNSLAALMTMKAGASVCHELNYSRDEISGLLNHATSNVTDLYVNRSIERLRKMYQSVADYLDLQVDFPEPDGPMITLNVPLAKDTFNFFSIGTPFW